MVKIPIPTTTGLQDKVAQAFERATQSHQSGKFDASYRVLYVIYQIVFGTNARWAWYPSGENMIFEYNGTKIGILTSLGNFAMVGDFFANATITGSTATDVEGNAIP